jgi:Protein of unknown function (DUF1525)
MRLRSETPAHGPLVRDEAALRPLPIDLITYAPVAFFHCTHCEFIWRESDARIADRQQQLASSLPAELQHEYQALSDWVRRLAETHGARLRFRIIDAVSVEGWIASVRYGVRRYPAVIVDGQAVGGGAALERAAAVIEERLAAPSGSLLVSDLHQRGRLE